MTNGDKLTFSQKPMFSKKEGKPDFNNLELEILEWWKQNDILNKSIDQRPIENSKTFYDGPITANGAPHYGHMLTFAMKDIIPRYWSMKGYRVSRSLGWDCQGIPVEYEIEKKLGFKEKKDIEEFGIEKFNQLCRESVLEFRSAIIELEERMGRLTNTEEEFATMDPDYIESVWWSLKQLHEKELLYEGFKVVPYSTRAGTSLSNAEVALGGYKPFTDPAITVAFPLKNDPKTKLLAWTTTPWTIPANLGLAVSQKIEYVKVEMPREEGAYVVAKELVEAVFEEGSYKISGEIKAEDLIGQEYLAPFDYFKGRANVHKIYEGHHVTTESGTGIVHLAPYGAEDNDIFQEVGIESFDMLDEQGDFNELVPNYTGKNYREANPEIVEELKDQGVLFKHEEYEHDMPMCWRTNTPLIYKPITSWYIAMSQLRKQLVANNDQINWTPSHMKDGRFGNWLAEIKDWGISRLRYWGTPLPVWKTESGKVKLIGSFAELEELSGIKITDPHRPFVDEVTFEIDGEIYSRIPDVIDVWYDSGAMPFARFHHPFENEGKFEDKFPADYIAEGVDQTRGWFYSLTAVATALFNKPAFKNVVVNGFTLDDNGMKQSKSKKNYEPPQKLLESFGADAIRLNFFGSPITTGEDATVSAKTAKLQAQEFLLPFWNSFSFFTTYANIHNWEPNAELAYNQRNEWTDAHPWDHIPFDDIQNELDAWILAILQNTIGEVTMQLNQYNMPKATKALKEFLSELSKWYIRRSRDRFNAGEEAALSTLYYVLVEFSKLAAPFVPFITEYMYQRLVADHLPDQVESVHLCDYPVVDVNFLNEHTQILPEMETTRKITELGQIVRANNSLKVRQPLGLMQVEFSKELDEKGAYLSDWMIGLISSELNVKEVKEVPAVSTDIRFVTEQDGKGIKVGMDTHLSPELLAEGTVRELTRKVQSMRKQMGLDMSDRVDVSYSTPDSELQEIIEANNQQIMETVGAASFTLAEKSAESEAFKLNDFSIQLEVMKA